MSTQTEITRLQTARNKLRTWLVGLGLAASTDKLDALADKAAAIKNNGAVDANVKEGESYTIPAGYHNGSGTVKGVSGSSMDTWLNNTWLKLLDADIQAAISKTKFYYTTGNGNNTVTTLQRAVFLLSVTELGKSSGFANTEGTALASAVCSQLAIAYYNGNATTQWTRTPSTRDTIYVFDMRTDGGLERNKSSGFKGSRPTFTLPDTLPVIQNPDGTYTIAA